MMTTKVLSTSDAECTASEIIAPELAKIPAINLKTDRAMLTKMDMMDTRMAIFLLLLSLYSTSSIFFTDNPSFIGMTKLIPLN